MAAHAQPPSYEEAIASCYRVLRPPTPTTQPCSTHLCISMGETSHGDQDQGPEIEFVHNPTPSTHFVLNEAACIAITCSAIILLTTICIYLLLVYKTFENRNKTL